MGRNRQGFTLVELLVVMAIIGILLALVLVGANKVLDQSKRSRAKAEIAAFANAIEAYKSDNGAYPAVTNPTLVPAIAATPPYDAKPGDYANDNNYLLGLLSGHVDATGKTTAFTSSGSANITGHTYYSFNTYQIVNPGSPNTCGIKDPFNNLYGYCTGTAAAPPMNGAGQYDIWSTAGKLGTGVPATEYNAWITNWGN